MSKNYIYPASVLCDFYKISHREQYPSGTEFVYSTWTPRASRYENVKAVVAFGFQAFIKEYLIDYFNENFFNRSKEDVVSEFKRVIKHTLGVNDPDASHIAALHDLGYLPVKIKAVKEGTVVTLRVPMLTIENTKPEFFWLTNYLETLMSCELWSPSTTATIALEFRRLLNKYAEMTGGDSSFVPFQGHDFSMRGMSSLESAKSAGAGHLLSFVGTDTIPSILFFEQYYNANIENELIGTSVNATEHSVMCAGGKDTEFDTYNRLINEVYPTGILSIVSDTWDLWGVLNNTIRTLKDDILKRDGKVVIRPDSGDPVKIICGDPDSENENERKGVIQILWEIFGGKVNEKGFKELDPHIGAIYGDAINLIRCEEICKKLMENGFASTNIVFGIGSFSYQFNTRDTFNFALKATHVVVNGEEKFIQKDPVTDSGMKKSATGRVAVLRNYSGRLDMVDTLTIKQQENFKPSDLLEEVFVDGVLIREETLTEIRNRLAKSPI